MKKWFVNSDGLVRSGWRILATVAAAVALIAAVNVGWRAVGFPGGSDASPWEFAGFAVLVSSGLFLIILAALKGFENRGPDAIWMPLRQRAVTDLLLGALLGAIPIALYVAVATLGEFGVVARGGLQLDGLLSALVPMLLAGFVLAAWEEYLLRGYLLRQFSLGINPTAAVIITGILFGLLHAGNPGANWQGLVYTAIGGILMGFLVLRSGSLWLLIGYHFSWNATASELFGLELSGFETTDSVFLTRLSGADWQTGGSYGFEASFPVAVIEVVVLGAALWLVGKTSRATPLNQVP